MPGYHIRNIERGVIGEASKVMEEAEEFIDACEQGCSIMALVELSDLMGAMKMYLENYHPEISLKDLETMSLITRRAFESGHRN